MAKWNDSSLWKPAFAWLTWVIHFTDGALSVYFLVSPSI